MHVGAQVNCSAPIPGPRRARSWWDEPYWGLRDYGVDGQIGLEESIDEWLRSLVAVFDQVHRVLRDDGTFWLNVGDAYAGLSEANLSGAYLSRADLSGAHLPTGYRIASLCFGGWPVTVTPEATTIGCQKHANEKWLAWQPADVREMHMDAEAWWARHREAVCAVIRDVMQTS